MGIGVNAENSQVFSISDYYITLEEVLFCVVIIRKFFKKFEENFCAWNGNKGV